MSTFVTRSWRQAHPNPDVAELIVYNNGGRLPPPPSVPPPLPPIFEECGHADTWRVGDCQHPACVRRHRREVAAFVALFALPLVTVAYIILEGLP